MEDRVLQWLAVFIGCLGLLLLALAPHTESDRYELSGTIIGKHGHSYTINTNVTLVARTGTVGEHIAIPTFWDGAKFIAVSEVD